MTPLPSKVMVIPRSDNRYIFLEALELGFDGKGVILCFQHVDVFCISIYIVPKVNEEVGFMFYNEVEYWLRCSFFGAGAEGDFGD